MRIVSRRTQQLARQLSHRGRLNATRTRSTVVPSASSISGSYGFTSQGESNHVFKMGNTSTSSGAGHVQSRLISNGMRMFSTAPGHGHHEALREQGIFDDRNLLRFDTLYELQKHSSIAFESNPIFGTYTDEGGNPRFEYMDYTEFGKKVDQCRSVLKDLGE